MRVADAVLEPARRRPHLPRARRRPGPERRCDAGQLPFTVAAAPETFIDSGPEGELNSAIANFQFSSDQTAATFECSLDLGSVRGLPGDAPDHAPDRRRAHADGPRPEHRRASSTSTPEEWSWTVSGSPPDTTVVSGPAVLDHEPERVVRLLLDRGRVDLRVLARRRAVRRVRGAERLVHHLIEAVPLGQHTLRVRAIDADGFFDPTPASHTWTVVAPPQTTIHSGPADPTDSTERDAHLLRRPRRLDLRVLARRRSVRAVHLAGRPTPAWRSAGTTSPCAPSIPTATSTRRRPATAGRSPAARDDAAGDDDRLGSGRPDGRARPRSFRFSASELGVTYRVLARRRRLRVVRPGDHLHRPRARRAHVPRAGDRRRRQRRSRRRRPTPGRSSRATPRRRRP